MAAYRLRTSKQRSFFIIMDFYKVLKSFTNDNRLNFSDILVLSVLVTHVQYQDENDSDICLSYADIKSEFERLSISSIRRSLVRLADTGYIKYNAQSNAKMTGKANTYTVLLDVPRVTKTIQKPNYQEKNTNKIQSSDDYIAEVATSIRKNPFLQ